MQQSLAAAMSIIRETAEKLSERKKERKKRKGAKN